jgi:hypothetical protein
MRMQVPEFPKNLSEADIFSYQKLPEVSRSFAAVIAELPEELRRPVLPHPWTKALLVSAFSDHRLSVYSTDCQLLPGPAWTGHRRG